MIEADQPDAPLWLALNESALGRLVTALSAPFVAAAPASRAANAWRGLREQFQPLEGRAQMRAAGITMVAAVAVHVGLAAVRQPVGYWWLIVPATALLFGLTAIVLSRLGRSPR